MSEQVISKEKFAVVGKSKENIENHWHYFGSGFGY